MLVPWNFEWLVEISNYSSKDGVAEKNLKKSVVSEFEQSVKKCNVIFYLFEKQCRFKRPHISVLFENTTKIILCATFQINLFS